MHPAVKALIAWCVAAYGAGLAHAVLRLAILGVLDHLLVLPGIVRTLLGCLTGIPFSTALCLGVFVLAVVIRMGLRRFRSGAGMSTGVSFAGATLAVGPFTVGNEWVELKGGMIAPAEYLIHVLVLAAPYGLAAFGVYWTVYRGPVRPDVARVF